MLLECFFGRVVGAQSVALSKNKPHFKYWFDWFTYLLRTTAYQRKLQRKE